MSKKSLLSGSDKEMQELAEQYEISKAENKPIYLDADDLADLADWYAMHGKEKEAIEVTEYGLALHPGSTPLLVEQAYLFIDTQKREKAREIIEQISDDYSSEVKVLKANILFGDGKTEEAEQLLDSIEDEDKEDLANIVDIAYMYIDAGYPEKATPWLEKGFPKHAEDDAYLAAVADYFRAQGMEQEAEKYYNKLIDKNPYSAPYWFGLARCYFEQRKFDKAIEACDFAIVADEEFSEAYIMKGHAFHELGNEDKALENYTLADKYKAMDPYCLQIFIGFNEIANENWAEAYRHFEEAIQYKDEDSIMLGSVYAHTALCLYKLGNKQKAEQYFAQAHEIDPKDVEAYLIEGRTYMEDGQADKAVEKWDMALAEEPCAEIWNEIGRYCAEFGHLNYARIAFEQVKELEPDFDNINEKLTAIYLLFNDKENVLKYNSLCEHPLPLDKLTDISNLPEGDRQRELMKRVADFLSILRG